MKSVAALLGHIGRHGTLLAALSIFIGLLLPGLPPLLKPSLGTVIVIMLTLAFLRVDPVALKSHVRRPGLIAAAAVWLMLASPALLGLLFYFLRVERSLPGLYFIVVLQISAPALMSAPAIAALLGLDVALTLATLIASVALTPLTAGLFTHLFLGHALASPVALGIKLFLIIAGSALAATVIRGLVGSRRLETQRERIDGLSVVSFVIFAIAAMDGVTAHISSDPKLVAGVTVLAFALSLAQTAIGTLLFLPAGRGPALAIGLAAGNRNLGLMLTATGFGIPDTAWLYFAAAQVPAYILPHLLRPLARRLTAPPGQRSGQGRD
jgi:BASS family bile acid:Na+ symporter